MPNQKKKPSQETLEILKLYDKRLEDKEIAKRLGLRPASVRARKAHRTMETYDLKAMGPKVDSSGLALTKNNRLAIEKELMSR